MISRRHFIRQSFAATAGMSLIDPLHLAGAQGHESPISFDMHAHPGAFFYKGHPNYPGDTAFVKTMHAMTEGKLTGAFISLVADAPLLEVTPTGIKSKGHYTSGAAHREYRRQYTVIRELLRSAHAMVATKASDLVRARHDRKVAAFLACEGSEFLEGKPDELDHLYADGVRSVQLVHYAPNVLGDLQTSQAQHHGLSTVGKEVVKKMNKLGMVIDVAHASEETVKAVADLTTAPVILSHSILKMNDDRPLSVRAISPSHAKLVAGTGGVIGAWPSGFNASFDEFVDNTKRLIDAAGIDHVGLGTDMDGNFKPVFSSYAQLPDWSNALHAKGLGWQDVAKVLGGNMQRVLIKVLGH